LNRAAKWRDADTRKKGRKTRSLVNEDEQAQRTKLYMFRNSGGAKKFIEPGQNFVRKFTCDIIYK